MKYNINILNIIQICLIKMIFDYIIHIIMYMIIALIFRGRKAAFYHIICNKVSPNQPFWLPH